MQRIRLQHDGREVVVIAERIQGRLWYHLDGQTYVYDRDNGSRTSRAAQSSSADLIAAPMPGKILRIEVKPGDKVAVGQVLVVMEAMKMEYTLTAAIQAHVETVGCEAGAQVKLGQTLVRLKEM